MISEEEKKAIENDLKCLHNVMNNFEDELCEQMQEKVKAVKQFIEKQNKEIQEKELKLQNITEKGAEIATENISLYKEISLKDKTIDEMETFIYDCESAKENICYSNINGFEKYKTCDSNCYDCISQYFRKKVEK